MKNVLIIFNPKAGRNRSRQTLEYIIRAFRNYNFNITEKTTTCVGDATEIVKKNYKDKDLIVCCGGDGTFNETVNGVIAVNTQTPIMYYHFTYIAGFGVGTDISFSTSQKMKNKLGHFAYLLNGFFLKLPDQIKKIKPHHMEIEYDGKKIEDDFYFGVILNTNEFAGIFKLDKQKIKLNDGLYDVLRVKEVNGFIDALRLLHKIRMQNYDNDRMIRLSVSELKIRGKEFLPWTLDGEYGGKHKDVDFKVLHSKVYLVANETDFFIKEQPEYKIEENVFDEEIKQSSKRCKR